VSAPCLTCGTPTRNRPAYCDEHRKRGYNPRSPHWRAVRAQRLELDQHQCRLNHPGCTGHATSVHLDPDLAGDHSQASIANTISACAHCHGVEDGPRATGGTATSRRRIA
jgi:hypothetical protein